MVAGDDGATQFIPSGQNLEQQFRVLKAQRDIAQFILWKLEDGITGEVKKPIIQSMNDMDRYQLPWEMLDEAVFTQQNQAYKDTDKFVIAGSHVRPFERMQFLRGTENLFVDIALEDPLFLQLKDRLHEFNLLEMKMLAA